MFKKILIPTDGSDVSAQVSLAGVQLAKQLQAEIVVLFVAPTYQYPMDVEYLPIALPTEQDYIASMQKIGDGYLNVVQQAAQAANLTCKGMVLFSDSTAKQIVQCAQSEGCDLIYMGSHGRGGWGQLLLGSVTNKVLSSCKIPVLVDRLREAP